MSSPAGCLRYKLIGAASIVFGAALVAKANNLEEPTHREVAPIQFEIGPNGKIETMAMDSRGRLLCGVSWSARDPEEAARDPEPPAPPRKITREDMMLRRHLTRGLGVLEPLEPRNYAIKVVDEAGTVLATWPMTAVTPTMIHGCQDGTIYLGGHGKLARFANDGKLLQVLDTASILEGQYKDAHISGVTANETFFFVAFGDGFSLRAVEDIVRFRRDFSDPQLIVKRQFGCCSHIDLDTKGDLLLVAENSRHRVNRFSFEGHPHDTWGRRDRQSLEGFAACCNPVNFDFGPNGVLYTAESGVGRVKTYSADGMYLGLVGYVDTTVFDRGSRLAAQSCYIPIEVNRDASRIFVMDVRAHIIRVLAPKPAVAEKP